VNKVDARSDNLTSQIPSRLASLGSSMVRYGRHFPGAELLFIAQMKFIFISNSIEANRTSP